MTRIVADACCNHLGDRRLIEKMIVEAKTAGVDIIKFQLLRADELNPKWANYKTAYENYKKAELSKDDCAFIFVKCYENNIESLFTAFSLKRAKFLKEELGQSKVKIASPDGDNEKLLNYCWNNFDLTIVSAGMTDIQSTKRLLRNKSWVKEHKILYCISKYPTKYEDIDFDKMQLFDGFSDHTEGIQAAKKAIDNGMEYIERHFTLGKYLPGTDHKFSSTPDEFKELCEYRDYKQNTEQYKRRWTNEC
jgi:N-acetylneuraminate synthase/N,N'-diacetyllegionaminate synthase